MTMSAARTELSGSKIGENSEVRKGNEDGKVRGHEDGGEGSGSKEEQVQGQRPRGEDAKGHKKSLRAGEFVPPYLLHAVAGFGGGERGGETVRGRA